MQTRSKTHKATTQEEATRAVAALIALKCQQQATSKPYGISKKYVYRKSGNRTVVERRKKDVLSDVELGDLPLNCTFRMGGADYHVKINWSLATAC